MFEFSTWEEIAQTIEDMESGKTAREIKEENERETEQLAKLYEDFTEDEVDEFVAVFGEGNEGVSFVLHYN